MSFQETLQANILEIRALAASFMLDTCIIYRKTGDTVVSGENIVQYDSGETSACRLILRSGSDSTNIASQERLAAQANFTGLYRLQLPFGTSITTQDRIKFTDIALGAIRTFEIIFVPPFNNMMGAFIITIKEVT